VGLKLVTDALFAETGSLVCVGKWYGYDGGSGNATDEAMAIGTFMFETGRFHFPGWY
jgi:hypothetical protein